MKLIVTIAVLPLFAWWATPAQAQPEGYIEIIVTACPAVNVPLEPTNQGHSFDNDPDPEPDPAHPLANHFKLLKTLHCIDVPIPAQALASDMTMGACMGQGGYIAAMQFLQGRPDLSGFPDIGAWNCILRSTPPTGLSNM